MTQEEILEYNKRCAEFLGWEIFGPGFPAGYWNGVRFIQFHELKFHSDWNWIMPVLQKINNLKEGKWYVHISDGESYPVVRIEDGNDIPQFDVMINVEGCVGFGKHLHLSKLEATYLAVVEFIKWYNDRSL